MAGRIVRFRETGHHLTHHWCSFSHQLGDRLGRRQPGGLHRRIDYLAIGPPRRCGIDKLAAEIDFIFFVLPSIGSTGYSSLFILRNLS